MLVENSVWNQLLRLINQSLSELKVSKSQDSETVIHKCLMLLENMLDLQPEVVSNKLMHSDNFIDLLILMQERTGLYASADIGIAAFCSELMCRIIQNCHEDFRLKFSNTLGGMSRLLALSATCSNHSVDTEEEISFYQSHFDALSSLLLGSKEQKNLFTELDGFKHMCTVMAQQKMMRSEALKVMSFALTQCNKNQAVEFIKNAGGLPLVFGYFMRT